MRVEKGESQVQKLRNLMGRIEIRVMFLLACGVLLTCFALAVAQFTKSSAEFDPPTISSWDDLVKEYLIFRAHSYPLVAPDGCLPSGQTEEILKEYGFEELQKGPHWYWHFDGGVFYFDDNSPLAKLVNDGERVLIYEDLAQEELLVLSMPEKEGEQPREEIVYDSPAWPEVREDENDDADLWRELSKRRIAWQVTLKSKSLAEKELAVAVAPATLLKSSGDGGGMRMMGMEETSNHLWLSIQGPAQGMTNIEVAVHIPEGFTNRLDMFTCTNLIEFWWTLASTNLSTEGMNIVCWADNPPKEAECCYYAVGNADVDSDVDGLTDAREKFLYHTSPTNADTDGDGASDGAEIGHSTNPLNNPGDTDTDGLSDDQEIVLGTDPESPDTDLDWFGDGYERTTGSDPTDSASTPPLLLEINQNAFVIRSTNLVVNIPGVVCERVVIGETTNLTNGCICDLTTNMIYGLKGESNGLRQIYGRLYRNTVEQSSLFNGSITFDNIPPVLSNISPSNGYLTTRRWILITGIITDALSSAHVLIDGQWADGISGGVFQYDRYMLSKGTNEIIIHAEDYVGNMATQRIQVVLDTSNDTMAPAVTLLLPQDYEIVDRTTNWMNCSTFDDSEELYVQGVTDDDTAEISLLVVASDMTNGPFGTVVISTQMWGKVSLFPGTNALIVLASDAAGNSTTGTYMVVRDTSFFVKITNPPAYQVLNSPSVMVAGTASPQFIGATITVNGVATEISDHGSNISFSTIQFVPLNRDYTELMATAQLNGRSYYADPHHYGYEILSYHWDYDYRVADRLMSNTNDYYDRNYEWHSDTDWNAFECDLVFHYWMENSCDVITHQYRLDPPMGLLFGCFDWKLDFLDGTWWQTFYYYDGLLHFVKHAPTQELQCVIFQFKNLDYGRVPGHTINPTEITYRGQTGIWYNSNVSFILPLRTEVEYPMSVSDFTWPAYFPPSYPECGGIETDRGHWLCFGSFTNDVLKVSLESDKAMNSPKEFKFGKTDLEPPCDNPPSKAEALVIYYNQVFDYDTKQLQDFDVALKVLPDGLPGVLWSKIDGPASGSLINPSQSEATFRNPDKGGVYQFGTVLDGKTTRSQLLLPLGGPDVTDYFLSEAERYGTWMTTMKTRLDSVSSNSFVRGSLVLAYFTKTVANMNHKLQDFESGPSPCKTYCDGTVTISGYVFGKDHLGNFLFSYLAARTGFTFGVAKLGANLVALLTQKVPDNPDDQAAYVAGFEYGENPSGDFKTILESKDIPAMQTEPAKRGWPSTDTGTGATYPTWGATHAGLDTPD